MSKYQVERPRHLREIERLDEQARVADLPAAPAAHPAPQLLLDGPASPLGLLLESPERAKVSLRCGDLFDRGGTESANQLVLQICDAHVEAEPFHVRAGEVRAEACPLEAAPEVMLLCGVAQAGQSDVESVRAEEIQKAADGLRAPDRHDRDAFGVEIPAAAFSQRFERALVADPLDEDHGTWRRAVPDAVENTR